MDSKPLPPRGLSQTLAPVASVEAVHLPALHIHRWSQYDVGALGFGLIGHQRASLVQQIRIECRPQCGSAGKASGRNAVEEPCAPYTVWPI